MNRSDFIILANALRATEPRQEDGARWLQWLLDVKAISVEVKTHHLNFDQDLFELNCQARRRDTNGNV